MRASRSTESEWRTRGASGGVACSTGRWAKGPMERARARSQAILQATGACDVFLEANRGGNPDGVQLIRCLIIIPAYIGGSSLPTQILRSQQLRDHFVNAKSSGGLSLLLISLLFKLWKSYIFLYVYPWSVFAPVHCAFKLTVSAKFLASCRFGFAWPHRARRELEVRRIGVGARSAGSPGSPGSLAW